MTDSEKIAFVEHLLSVGRQDGRREERDAVIALLRASSSPAWHDAAACIEQGDHLDLTPTRKTEE